MIAEMIVRDFLSRDPRSVVVFLAPTVALVDQQANVFQNHFCDDGLRFRVLPLYGMGEIDRLYSYPGQFDELLQVCKP